MITNILLFLSTVILLNVYAFRGICILAGMLKNNWLGKIIIRSYFIIDILFIIFSLVWIIIVRYSEWHDFVRYRNYFYISGAFALIYFPRFAFVPFVFINDLKTFFVFLTRKAIYPLKNLFGRLKGFSVAGLLLSSGLLVSTAVFLMVVYGISIGKTNFKINEVEIHFDALPSSFDGLTIAHISDTHLGSFKCKDNVIRGLNKIACQEPDLILFTGDLINNEAVEAAPFIDAFSDLEPPYGKFSVLGNHDLGDYRRWYMIEEKDPDMDAVVEVYRKMGFDLLRNRHVFLYNGGDSIMIAGVDSWGLPPFEKAGDLKEALSPHHNYEFIILLSHDPSHWAEKIQGRENIRLTLSGHTHGMQFGINICGIRWSPAKYYIPYWKGLYRYNGQYLYVNPGFGFVGMPLRIGMPPEITMITLKRE